MSESKRVRYLLDLCSQAEREHIESEYFEDGDAFQKMLTAEDDLIDAYTRGELQGEERLRFEKRFVNSLSGRERVKFAHAFAGVVSTTQPVEPKISGTWLNNIFKTFQLPSGWRTATIAISIVFLAVVAWLVNDRKRMINELQKLRTEFAELGKRTEALPRNSYIKETATPEIAAQPAKQKVKPDKSKHRIRETASTQRPQPLPKAKTEREKIASIKPEPSEPLVGRNDASLGNTFTARPITELPLERSNVVGLLTLQPGQTHDGFVPEGRDETTIRIPNSHKWIRFHIPLATAARHEDYLVIIKTADGRPVTSVNWSEPHTPNQTIVDTPVISTSDLPSGDYVLLLMGEERDGSFVKVTEYSFKVIKYSKP
jgi:hypothetical protein